MAKFAKGDSVIFVENNAAGVIVDVFSNRGKQFYEVRWIKDGGTSFELESRLEPERKLDNPFDRLAAGVYGSFVDFSRLNTQYKIENTSVNTISTLKASRTIFKPYQYKPLLKFLNSDTRRILIGDEVGLGKTIEAGHIMLEMKARKELGSALIVCPKSLKAKWRDELEVRFDLHFKEYEHKTDLIADIKSHRPLFGIVTYRAASVTGKNDIYAALEESSTILDLIICDEAHAVRNFGTDQTSGVQRLLALSRSAIFMTATPIMTSTDNLYTLLRLLDEDQFRSPSVFQNILNANKPFVAAISELNAKKPFVEIASNLKNAQLRYVYRGTEEGVYEYVPETVADDYGDNPLFQRIIKDLESKEETDANRVRIQYDLSSISLLNNVLSRTTKRDVTTDWSQAIRDARTVTVELTQEEIQAQEQYLKDYCREHYYTEDISQANPLALSSQKKLLASSIIAYTSPWATMKRFPVDSKYRELQAIIDEVVKGQHKKLIVFAGQIKTLRYLEYRLSLDGCKAVFIDGSVKDRLNIIKKFRLDPDINVLLSSEVGGEGLDMQFCDTMVNYDLPWNPMVVEQRIGRIDRFGQKSKVVHIYNLLVKGTLQEKIYGRLLSRIGIFRECIGDLEAILDGFLERQLGANHTIDFSTYLERELESPGITEEEIERKLDSMKKAIEQVKLDAAKLGEDLKDTLTNDIYFREEIGKIQETGRYITEAELVNYVRSLIDNVLTTCRFSWVDDNLWRISVLKSDAKALTNFLTTYQPADANIAYKDFLNYTRDLLTFDVTFNQQYAYENGDCLFINAYHPLVQAITEYYKKTDPKAADTFKLALDPEEMEGKYKIADGQYVLGIYLIDILREIFHTTKHNQILVPLLYECGTESFVEDRDLCEYLLARVQESATLYRGGVAESEATSLQLAFTEEITAVQERYKEDYAIRAESSKMVLKKRTQAMFERQIDALERSARYAEISDDPNQRRIAAARWGQVRARKEEMQRELDAIDANRVSVCPNRLISLTMLNIG